MAGLSRRRFLQVASLAAAATGLPLAGAGRALDSAAAAAAPAADAPSTLLQTIRQLSSGNRAYDEAVERAILKSSPLPKPDQAEVFQRQLSLKFRPLE